jgi:hypothetical protein
MTQCAFEAAQHRLGDLSPIIGGDDPWRPSVAPGILWHLWEPAGAFPLIIALGL